ncbi:uncharacterized protein DUF4239 [Methylovirgula ligni]|uniref:Uncharacterized protein DUF4239 n=2 Tax=Methylovirgula ligni TaxID=569860 RepID=A0A3D9YMV0_9HYPH|nr:uncharacterized protein DUF4239 [Methylovirgula ligni]
MIDFLTTAPLWVEILLVVIIPTVIAMLGPSLIRRFVQLEHLAINNEVAGFKFATIGVTYAVLLAFSIVVVWEKASDAESTIEREAGAAATIYRLSNGLGEPKRTDLRTAMTRYLSSTIKDEWSTMEHGKSNKPTWEALGDLYTAMIAPGAADDVSIKTEIFNQLTVITQARRARLIAADGIVPGPVWAIVFLCAFLVIGFTFFFGTQNLRAQTLMTGLLAFLIFSELVIVIALERPFAGGIKEAPTPLVHVLQDFAPS